MKRWLVVTFLCVGAVSRAQSVPPTEAKTLNGSTVSFPRAGSSKPLLLLIGFSHESGKQCEKWNKRLKPIYLSEPRIDYYELADFQGVPSFVMWTILHGMRRETPKDEQSRFVLLYSNGDNWKKLVGYSAPDDAYLIVADPVGNVLWQAHGEPNDARQTELRAVLGKQLAKP